MDEKQDTTVEAFMEHLIEHGPNDMATVFARAFELAMQIVNGGAILGHGSDGHCCRKAA
ncbi:hypothetical protein ACGYLX_18610 [Sulfitobacter sp. 1A13496]|uniref:hypothetical protein n=1 Tax=Sulfitobacter sp. 1A13496 TaxID=3368596 RepID=UPI003744F8FB